MATVSALYRFANGDQAGVTIVVENDYPDALAEAAKTCMTALRETACIGICVQDAAEPTPDP